jgi:hypothetical protein
MWYGSFAYFGSALEQGSNRSSAARKFDDAGRGGGGLLCALVSRVCLQYWAALGLRHDVSTVLVSHADQRCDFTRATRTHIVVVP